MTPSSSVPRLLVSVRDAREAVCAVQGGADVIDFKNPDRGPLGRADAEAIETAIAEVERQGAGTDANRITLSAAMGEVVESSGPLPQSLPASVEYLKLGLSGLRHSSNWIREWLHARTIIQQQAAGDVQWVAVAYADADAAHAPSAIEVVQAAAETSCAGVLIDTFNKSGGRLLDHLDTTALRDLARSTQSRHMFFAVAGRLQIGDLALLRDVCPDIIAVRSAACDGENRRASIVSMRVAAVREAIHCAFHPENRRVTVNAISPIRSDADARPAG